MARVRINEIPNFLAEDTYDKTHSIIVDDPLNPNEPLIILLVLKGITSYFPSRKPIASDNDYESITLIELTSETSVWEPYETGSTEKEDAMTDFRAELISSGSITRG